jgi:hypothetical protein
MVSDAMRRNRFLDLKRYLHCANNTQLDRNDKFAKVRPVIDRLNRAFREHAQFTRKLSADERYRMKNPF